MSFRDFVDRVAPRYTDRRLAIDVARTAVRTPSRFSQRVNRENRYLRSFYSEVTFTCPICGETGAPYFDMPDLALRREHGIGVLRETLQCRSCGATMRDRTLARTLLSVLGISGVSAADGLSSVPDDVTVLDTDNHSALSRIERSQPGFVRSQFLAELPNGAQIDGPNVINVNLEDMPFEDERFDVILTSDVMEHVRDVDAAHAEIARCLKPGGRYVFTLPYDEGRVAHRVLIDTSTERDIPLDVPHFHGDPVDSRIKAYRIFGRQIFEDLAKVGLSASFESVTAPEEGIFGGDVFVAVKD